MQSLGGRGHDLVRISGVRCWVKCREQSVQRYRVEDVIGWREQGGGFSGGCSKELVLKKLLGLMCQIDITHTLADWRNFLGSLLAHLERHLCF